MLLYASIGLLCVICAGPTMGESGFVQLDSAPPSKIAVIGGGIGGTATAHFLRQHFGPEVRIDVFEKREVGGRLATVTVNNQVYETGGSIIHSLNLHMQDFMKQLGLKYRRSVAGKMAVFNGKEFILEETDWYLLDLFRLWWRYGISFIRMQMWVEEIMEKFMRIYKYQAHGYAFSSVEELLNSLGGSGFLNMTRRSLSESLLELGVSQRFIDDIVAPIMRVNYGQNVSMPAFVGESHQYKLSYTTQAEIASDIYDIVVIATPLQENINPGISFLGFEPKLPEITGSYHTMVASIVHGYLNCTYFGFSDPKLFPFTSVLTTETADLFFNSASSICPVNISTGFRRKQPHEARVYKVFSPKPLEKDELKTLFKSYYSVQVIEWKAYPRYGSSQEMPPMILHDNLYYLNGIEWAASAMEMSSVTAKNIALLAYYRWSRQLEMIDQKDLMHKIKTEL
ncbi:prenylcysteine oxidase-like isoform X3 [Neoarius graeffei]|uniref:prenylcysteine oxidase-like isoform X3 n=1 Tax=Neoarius graeffei TaxID=443677 RepID=UPI00298BD349|nr:prenylcysteine oxidase-like isoform X3 [Neoarius graeffei]